MVVLIGSAQRNDGAGSGSNSQIAAIRHQRQKEMTILDDVRADEAPVLDDAIVQGAGGHIARVSASGPSSNRLGPGDFQAVEILIIPSQWYRGLRQAGVVASAATLRRFSTPMK
jgi:hypothetical protein